MSNGNLKTKLRILAVQGAETHQLLLELLLSGVIDYRLADLHERQADRLTALLEALRHEFEPRLMRNDDDNALLGSLIPSISDGPVAARTALLDPKLRKLTFNALGILMESCARTNTASVGCSIQIAEDFFEAYQVLRNRNDRPDVALLNLSMVANPSNGELPSLLADLGSHADSAAQHGKDEFLGRIGSVGGLFLWALFATMEPNCSVVLYTRTQPLPAELQPFLIERSPLRLHLWDSPLSNEIAQAIVSTVRVRLRNPVERSPDRVVKLIQLANRINQAKSEFGTPDALDPLIDAWRSSWISDWRFQDLFVPWFVRLERRERMYETLTEWLNAIQEFGLVQSDLQTLYNTLMDSEYGNIAHPLHFNNLLEKCSNRALEASDVAECRQAQAHFTRGVGAFQQVGNLLELKHTKFEKWALDIARVFGDMVDHADNPELGKMNVVELQHTKQLIQDLKTQLDCIFRLPQLVSLWGEHNSVCIDTDGCRQEHLDCKLDGKQGRPCLPIMPDLIEFLLENWYSNVVESPCVPIIRISDWLENGGGISVSLICSGHGANVLDVKSFHCEDPRELHTHYRKNAGSSLIARIHGGFQIAISGYEAYDSRDGQIHKASDYLPEGKTRLEGTSQQFVFPYIENPAFGLEEVGHRIEPLRKGHK